MAMSTAYPAVRWFSRRSLVSLATELEAEGIVPGLADDAQRFDYLADPADRERDVRSMMERWTNERPTDLPPPPEGTLLDESYRPDMDAIVRLIRTQSTKVIQIGE